MRIANVTGRAHLVLGTPPPAADPDASFVDGVHDHGLVGVDIAEASAGRFSPDPMGVLDRWGEVLAWARGRDLGPGGPIDPLTLGAPSPRPRQVFAVASNYRDRPAVVDTPADLPVTFTKFPGSVVGPHADLPLPTHTVDWEVELVVVIGGTVRAVTASRAWDTVAGLTVGQDFSERTLQLGGAAKQFSLGKSFPHFGPTGPVLVTPDEFADRDDLPLWCAVNAETVQNARTSQMIFSVPELIARLSAICTLFPGDLIFTGTPGGLGMLHTPPRYLRVGDEVLSHIAGIGTMRNRCVPPTATGTH